MTTIRNPWHRPSDRQSQAAYSFTGKPCLVYRGVAVYRTPAGSYAYTIDGCAIAERAGMSTGDKGRAVIDGILDGRTFVSDGVADHLSGLGFNAARYPA